MFKRIKIGAILGNPWLLLCLAVVIAATLTYVIYRYLSVHEAQVKATLTQRQHVAGIAVVVPVRDVPAGTPLSGDLFAAREIAADLVYDDMIRAGDFDAFIDSRITRPIPKGRPLRRADVDATRALAFSDRIPAGQRALTLEVDGVNATARMIKPGDHVDLYWIGTRPVRSGSSEAGEQRVARLLQPDVLVLATGQDVRPRAADEAVDPAHDAQRTDFDTVTVQVPSEDAPRLALAQRIGGIRMLLRNTRDTAAPRSAGASEPGLFADATAGDATSVEIIAGGQGVPTVTTSAPEAVFQAPHTGRHDESRRDAATPSAPPPALELERALTRDNADRATPRPN